MKEIAVDILLCIVDRQRTLMKGDKVVELLEKSSDMFFLIKLPRKCHFIFCELRYS